MCVNRKYICVCQQEKLQSVTIELKDLSDDIITRKLMLAKIEQEIQYTEKVRQSSKNKSCSPMWPLKSNAICTFFWSTCHQGLITEHEHTKTIFLLLYLLSPPV